MKIVINIPKKINNRLRSMLGHGYTLWDEDVKIIAEAVYNGRTQPEQAVKDYRNCKHGNYNDHWGTHFCHNPNKCIEWNLWEPIAQIERKRGKWIVHYECPKCGEITKDFTEYCPFCNADMRGEEDGSQEERS